MKSSEIIPSMSQQSGIEEKGEQQTSPIDKEKNKQSSPSVSKSENSTDNEKNKQSSPSVSKSENSTDNEKNKHKMVEQRIVKKDPFNDMIQKYKYKASYIVTDSELSGPSTLPSPSNMDLSGPSTSARPSNSGGPESFRFYNPQAAILQGEYEKGVILLKETYHKLTEQNNYFIDKFDQLKNESLGLRQDIELKDLKKEEDLTQMRYHVYKDLTSNKFEIFGKFADLQDQVNMLKEKQVYIDVREKKYDMLIEILTDESMISIEVEEYIQKKSKDLSDLANAQINEYLEKNKQINRYNMVQAEKLKINVLQTVKSAIPMCDEDNPLVKYINKTDPRSKGLSTYKSKLPVFPLNELLI